jgi:sterol desaturase/sphingolipid hydroxylase (fatty acid hydroxylase superfamily)
VMYFDAAQQALFEAVIQPVMLAMDMADVLEDGYLAAAWFLLGILQIAIIALVIVPLQKYRPAEPVVDRATIRVDMLYTAIHRLGVFRLGLYFLLQPLLDAVFGALRLSDSGFGSFHLDQIWPGVSDIAVISLLMYLVMFDFVDYWIHRAQHASRAWWALHSLHHAQTQMTCWSDNRNHLLDDLLRDVVMAVAAFMVGVSPVQFVLIVVLTQLSESLQHANLKLSFGAIGDRLWVSPQFHRLHHSVEHGFGHNFGVLLPWWDMLFGTAHFQSHTGSTGTGEPASHYGRGFWAQQGLGLMRLLYCYPLLRK